MTKMEENITLVVEGEHFQCNKTRLSEISDYFAVMLGGNFSESKQNIVELKVGI